MGWERRNGRDYYYTKERNGAQVKSVYYGRGTFASYSAQFDAVKRLDARREAQAELAERARLTQLDAEIDAFAQLVKQITSASLVALGFHTHKRQWRRRREQSKMSEIVLTVPENDQTKLKAANEYAGLLARVNTDKPQPADIDALRRAFGENSDVWQLLGNVANLALRTAIDTFCKSNALRRESVRHKAADLKLELGYKDAPPLERMLIDHVALAWLRLYQTEMNYTG